MSVCHTGINAVATGWKVCEHNLQCRRYFSRSKREYGMHRRAGTGSLRRFAPLDDELGKCVPHYELKECVPHQLLPNDEKHLFSRHPEECVARRRDPVPAVRTLIIPTELCTCSAKVNASGATTFKLALVGRLY